MPSLPAPGDKNWRDNWAQAVHNAATEVVSGRLTDSALQAAFGGGGGQFDESIPAYVPEPSRFDVERSLYRGERDTLRRWNAALARAASGGANAHLLVLADSIAGAGVLNTVNAWPSQLARALQDRLGWPGGHGWNTFADEGSTTADPLMVITGFVRDGNRGLHGEARTSTAAGQTIVYGPLPARTFRIIYANRPGGGSFNWSVDGGGTTTVNTANAAESIQTVTISAGYQNVIPHTLTISSLGADVTILAVEAVVQDSGRVKVTRGNRNGASIGDAITNTNPTSARGLAAYLTPDLTVIALETNNFQSQTPVATYKAAVATAIQSAQAVNSDVLLVATIPPNVNPGSITLAQYTAALYELADQYNVAVLDFQHRWVSYAVSNAAPYSLYADNLHPSAKGRTDYARAVYEAVADDFIQRDSVMLDKPQTFTGMQTFAYPGLPNARVRIGGLDAIGPENFTTPTAPYFLVNADGAAYLAAKDGQPLRIVADLRMWPGKAFVLSAVTTAGRPSASGLGEGAMIFDKTLGKPLWSNGTAWLDATGTPV